MSDLGQSHVLSLLLFSLNVPITKTRPDYLQLSFQEAQEEDHVVSGKVPAFLFTTTFSCTAGTAAPTPTAAGTGAVLAHLVVSLDGAGVVWRFSVSAASLGPSCGVFPLCRRLSCICVLLRQLGFCHVFQTVAARSHVPLPVEREDGRMVLLNASHTNRLQSMTFSFKGLKRQITFRHHYAVMCHKSAEFAASRRHFQTDESLQICISLVTLHRRHHRIHTLALNQMYVLHPPLMSSLQRVVMPTCYH